MSKKRHKPVSTHSRKEKKAVFQSTDSATSDKRRLIVLTGVLSAPYFTETGQRVHLSWALAVAAVAVAVITGVASSLYPAIKASKLDPTEALRYY